MNNGCSPHKNIVVHFSSIVKHRTKINAHIVKQGGDLMANKITYTCFVEYSDTGEVKPLADLPQEEKDRLGKLWGRRMGKALSDYYSAHPHEFERL